MVQRLDSYRKLERELEYVAGKQDESLRRSITREHLPSTPTPTDGREGRRARLSAATSECKGQIHRPHLHYNRSMGDDDLRRARDDARRYWLHNLYGVPDVGRIVTEYLGASRGGRWAITLLIVALIMTLPVIAVVIALLR